MKINIAASLLCIAFAATAVSAEEGVFLSLTRKARSISEMPTNVSVITAAEVAEKKAANAGELLKSEAGLTLGQYGTSYGGQTNVMLRGSSPEEVLVLIDGRRTNDPSMGLVNLGSIPAGNIEKIEIIRGGASAVYGTSAFGGIINIITKKPKDDATSAELGFTGGSFNTQGYKLNLNAKKGPLSGFASAGKSISDGWRDNSKFDGKDFFGRLNYEAGEYGNYDLSASLVSADYGVSGLGATLDKYDGTAEKAASSDAKQKDTKTYCRIVQELPAGENQFNNSVYVSQTDTNYEFPSNFQNDDYKTLVFGAESRYSMESGLTLGAEWWEEKYRNFDKMNSFDKIDRSRITTALYAQQELSAGAFAFIPSARCDSNSVFGSIVSPRVTVTWQASAPLKVSANTARAWRAPTFNELYWARESFAYKGVNYVTEGNSTLVPEEGITSDIGAEYTGKSFKAGMTAFLTDSRNLISWNSTFDAATNTSLYKTENINASRQTGAELTFSNKIASGLYQSVNYTYLWAEDTQNKRLLNYRPRNAANYTVTYLTAFDMKIDLTAQYTGEQETWEMSYPVLPEFTLLNLGISQKIRDTEIWARANNLTDKKYQTRNKYPLPGFNFSAGVTVKFWS